MIRIDVTHLGKDEGGLNLAPATWCAIVCEGCGREGPRRWIDGPHDAFAQGCAHAAAMAAGFQERPHRGITGQFCATCVGSGCG